MQRAFGIYNRAICAKSGAVSLPGWWITAHNLEGYAVRNYQETLNHLQNGTPFENTNTPPGMVYRPWAIEGILEAKEKSEAIVLEGE